ncbi:MAG: hypothetical protein A3G34_14490 [Candidatus Lindowbacteria bacterium RIFCSPLOWO2_12_FULL_62_27]|nr:MAG: hypothetical protein A3I06_15905 [Candidatus Lindowbacteria bacterium RIFCSPLOWO2_02_FULL_62_12]OGH63072.1 MAG: hypothetical protein A3G34_14490 [Candidatus Lindowbacteria bacterium RIFCSPLOWO2_12_FULL_62_27]
MGRMQVAERGDPKQVLRQCAAMGLDLKTVSFCLGVHPKTVERWLDGRSDPSEPAVRSLEKLDAICRTARRLLKPAAGRTWFAAPNKTLGGEPPLALIRRGELDRVRTVLGMLEWGIYS